MFRGGTCKPETADEGNRGTALTLLEAGAIPGSSVGD